MELNLIEYSLFVIKCDMNFMFDSDDLSSVVVEAKVQSFDGCGGGALLCWDTAVQQFQRLLIKRFPILV